MEQQLKFIEMLFCNFSEDCKKHITAGKWATLCDKNIGKTAIKRKIKILRQELLNLSKEIDKE